MPKKGKKGKGKGKKGYVNFYMGDFFQMIFNPFKINVNNRSIIKNISMIGFNVIKNVYRLYRYVHD